jgi:tricorn protease
MKNFVRYLITTLSVLMLVVNLGASTEAPFVRYPALSPDGNQVAFCFQGDIWTIPAKGGEAKRLTIHSANDKRPVWSRDGKSIAFSSNRFGNDDIYIIPSNGGSPKRLTYHSTSDTVSQWAPDGSILFNTRRLFQQVERVYEIYSLSPSGGTPHRLLNALGFNPVMSPDKRYIAIVRGSCRTAREDYKGPANRDLWLYDTKKATYTRLTDYEGNDFNPRWGDANTLYYLSSSSGRYNVHRLTITADGKASGSTQVTRFTDLGARYFDIDAAGQVLAIERGTSIYMVSLKGQADKAKLLDVNIAADYRFDPIEHKKVSSGAGEFAVSPNGKLLAFEANGEIFVTENDKKKSRAVNVSRHPFHDLSAQWLNDDTLLFASDRYGQFDLFLVKSARKGENIFKALKHKIIRVTNTSAWENGPVISPDRKKIAFLRGRGQFVVADISAEGKLTNEKLLLDGWSTPMGVAWSPDSKWLAYSLEDLDFNEEIFIHAADNSRKPVNISMHPRVDRNPVWSLDGSKLGFVSYRTSGEADIWFVWLKKKDWEKTKTDWDEAEDKPAKPAAPAKKTEKKDKKAKGKKDEKKEEVKPVVIDFKDIHERLAQVTRLAGDEYQLAISKDGETFYFSTRVPGARGRDLFSAKWDGTEIKAVTKSGPSPWNITLGPSGKYLYLLKSGGGLARISMTSKKMESLPYAGTMLVNYKKQREQVFDEAVRALTEGFYDPEYHGRDWKKLIATYKPMALKASTDTDFRYMFNLMLGQLDASHMGIYGSARGKLQREGTGLLGVEIEPLEKGVKVLSVLEGSPAYRQVSRLNEGDVILSVDGTELNGSVNFYSLLTNKAKERVLLEVKSKTGAVREVVIRPTSYLGSQVYDAWVKERRRLTEKYSNGRLGYLHIRAMNMSSFERFEREITACGYGKEGIVIDVRFNGGGSTTDYLMAVLNVKQHAYTIPRGAVKNLKKEHKKFSEHYAYGERLPFAVWTKASIALCNENSYSNAEIFSHAYKTLGIGKLVGVPTFGAVISTGGHMLMDGSYVRMPFRAWYVKATGENMEHGPAVPDIIVHNEPDSKAKGEDPQLKRAVDELLKEIDQK